MLEAVTDEGARLSSVSPENTTALDISLQTFYVFHNNNNNKNTSLAPISSENPSSVAMVE